jgi:hypothetical protein
MPATALQKLRDMVDNVLISEPVQRGRKTFLQKNSAHGLDGERIFEALKPVPGPGSYLQAREPLAAAFGSSMQLPISHLL